MDPSAPIPLDEDEGLLVDRARRGDAEAFRALVDRHRDRAYGVALRVLRSAPDAQEVAQDAFVKAWRALPGFRGESKFSTWLHSIVVRRALDRAATLKNRRAREVDLDAVAEPGAADAGTSADRTALRMRMERMLDRLSDAQRTVVTLYYYEERSVDDVATALGMPTGTVKTHLSRARATLREAWLAEHSEEAG